MTLHEHAQAFISLLQFSLQKVIKICNRLSSVQTLVVPECYFVGMSSLSLIFWIFFFSFIYFQLNPSYHEEKQRCEYLHNKLAHIKRLIADFDQRRAQAWC